ncbi:NAD-dependent epimerase/dehydratase family protein [Candidatus Pelagibacter sp.]|nr:NAD-dependent epimerase/dehydratase family protein [Candidatus Pelagibacter sp.]
MKKKILILGSFGHIGYSLSKHLREKNYEVIATYNKSKEKKKNSLFKKENIRLIKCDLKDKKKLKRIFQNYKINTCVCAAAVSHDSVAKFFPEKTINVNCYAIQNLIDLQKLYKFKLINISTGSVFQDIKDSKFKITEEIVPTPKSVYSSTKRLGEILINNSHETNQRSCNLRVSWVYGPPIILNKFDPQRGPIPFILSELFFKKKKELIFKSGSDFEASFTFIDDVTNVIEKMIKMKKFKFPTYHFGSGKNYKLSEVINFINKSYKNKKIISGPGYAPWSNDSVIRGPMITSNKINFYKPKINIKLGIKKYIKYISNK